MRLKDTSGEFLFKIKLFLVRNSFGTDWCIDGYCWITFAYMEEKLLDAWIFDIDLIT